MISRRNGGFTLIEVAVVLIISGYLLKQFVLPFGAFYQQKKRSQTVTRLETISDALTGFVITRHRLPCPADEQSAGLSVSACPDGNAVGYVPAATLGLRGPVDNLGRLLDSWGRPIVYVVSAADHPSEGDKGSPDFTTAGEMKRVGLSNLRSDIQICSRVESTGCSRNQVRANQVPYLLVSFGEDSSTSGQQGFNQDRDMTFVFTDFIKSTERSPGFDDILVWGSESQLIYNLVKAGTLP